MFVLFNMGVAFIHWGNPFFIPFFTVFFLLPEIESHVNAQASERIGHRESGFPVVVCVKYERGSDIVFAVVPSDACTRNQVEIDVSYPLCPVSSALGGWSLIRAFL